MELILASRNKKKIKEMEALLSRYVEGVEILSLDDVGFVGDIEENGETYECAIKPYRASDKAILNMLVKAANA